ncbi:hypothetical protein CC79DRAFT_1386304 [Sarocladium strictum]
MKLSVLVSIALATGRALAEVAQDTALDVLYYYSLYDLNYEIWGKGGGAIANKCRGSGKDSRCTFTEFTNYITTGKATSQPVIYDIPSDWHFGSGDVTTLYAAFDELIAGDRTTVKYTTLVDGTKTKTEVWEKLGYILREDHLKSRKGYSDMERFLGNIRQVMDAALNYRKADLGPKTLSGLRSRLKDVLWQTVENSSKFKEKSWQELDWEKTVKANPDLLNPKSELFKQVTYALNQVVKGDPALMVEKTLNAELARQVKLCF